MSKRPFFSVMPRQEDEDRDTLSENTPVKTRVGFLLSIGGFLVVLTAGWIGISQKVDAETEARKELAAQMTARQTEAAERLKNLETAQVQIGRMANDIEWIKQTLQEDKRRKGE